MRRYGVLDACDFALQPIHEYLEPGRRRGDIADMIFTAERGK
ncbi:MAG: hypothetical protein OEV33_00685 [Armatimonadota bacterium]|nr:hypothetical protein [Armatimonadota bacterium]